MLCDHTIGSDRLRYVLLSQVLLVRSEISGKDAGVHSWVKGLDTASEHFRGLGDSGDILNGKAGFSDELGCATRGEQADVLLDQSLSQVQQTGLVIDGEDGDFLWLIGRHIAGDVSKVGEEGEGNVWWCMGGRVRKYGECM